MINLIYVNEPHFIEYQDHQVFSQKCDCGRKRDPKPGPENHEHLFRFRISVLCKDDKLVDNYFDDIPSNTLYELFQSGLRKSPNGGCLGTRKENAYDWKTYQEVDRLARNVGASLVRMGMVPHKQTSMIGLYSKNRWEYDVTQLSCYYYGLIAVPIYETLGKEGC